MYLRNNNLQGQQKYFVKIPCAFKLKEVELATSMRQLVIVKTAMPKAGQGYNHTLSAAWSRLDCALSFSIRQSEPGSGGSE
jgi:hypothetical protein